MLPLRIPLISHIIPYYPMDDGSIHVKSPDFPIFQSYPKMLEVPCVRSVTSWPAACWTVATDPFSMTSLWRPGDGWKPCGHFSGKIRTYGNYGNIWEDDDEPSNMPGTLIFQTNPHTHTQTHTSHTHIYIYIYTCFDVCLNSLDVPQSKIKWTYPLLTKVAVCL